MIEIALWWPEDEMSDLPVRIEERERARRRRDQELRRSSATSRYSEKAKVRDNRGTSRRAAIREQMV